MEVDLIRSLYLGGCSFVPYANSGNETLATFEELPGKPAAVVHGELGKGRWLLCSTHPEFDAEALELMESKVIGNAYEDIKKLGDWRAMKLDALDWMIDVVMGPVGDYPSVFGC